MIRFDLLTIFPDIFSSYINESILGRARKAGLIKINPVNLRDYTHDKHKTTDDKPYGGGAGMVMKVEPIYEAVVKNSMFKIKATKNGLQHAKGQRIILLSAKGEPFTQAKAQELARYKQVMFISGRYEGVDERVAKYVADEELSIGPYVLSGGELPSLVATEAISRLIPGVLGNEESLTEESYANISKIGKQLDVSHPVYTRPEVFSPQKGIEWKVPKILLSGHHKKIQEWRHDH